MIGPSPLWIVKVGGEELTSGAPLARFVATVARCVHAGQRLVVVHGGGDEVTIRAGALGIATERTAGQRRTSSAMLEVVAEVLAGRINVRLTNALEGAGLPAVGLTGVSARMLKVRPAGEPPGSLGWVGDPVGAGTRLLTTLLDDGFTPVLAPLGVDAAGQVYNVNADLAAAAFAAALPADLIVLTDVPGVRGADGGVVGRLEPTDARRLVAAGVASAGMIPKLDAAIRATAGGGRAWIGAIDDLTPTGPRPGRGTLVAPGRRAPLPLLPSPNAGGR